jgi:hypothetical protein
MGMQVCTPVEQQAQDVHAPNASASSQCWGGITTLIQQPGHCLNVLMLGSTAQSAPKCRWICIDVAACVLVVLQEEVHCWHLASCSC